MSRDNPYGLISPLPWEADSKGSIGGGPMLGLKFEEEDFIAEALSAFSEVHLKNLQFWYKLA